MGEMEGLDERTDGTLSDEGQRSAQADDGAGSGGLEQRLEALRARLVERMPWTEPLIGGLDIKIGIAQTAGAIIGTALLNYLLYVAGGTVAAYTGVMAATFLAGIPLMAGAYAGVHYLMDRERYRGKTGELFREALRFTAISSASFVPLRLVSLGVEGLLVGAGIPRYIVGNVIPSILLTMQSLGANKAAKGMNEGESLAEALKDGFINLPRDLGRTFYSLAAAPYTLVKRGYEALCGYIAGRRAPAPAEMPYAAPLPSALEEAAVLSEESMTPSSPETS